jgi:alanine racemase
MVGPGLRTTRAEIDLGALAANAVALRGAAGVPLIGVVKADAYGHGAVACAQALIATGEACVASLAVSLIEEGAALIHAGADDRPILVMGPLGGAVDRRAIVELGLIPLVSDPGDLEGFAELGRERGAPVVCHLEIDTGMGRIGLPDAGLAELLEPVFRRGGLAVQGCCTHFADADLADAALAHDHCQAQLDRFHAAVAVVRAAGAAPVLLHAANSAALVRLPAARLDRVRPGLALYGNGLSPVAGLDPVMRLVAHVAQLRAVGLGEPVGYGGLWRAPRPSRIAVLPIGYADGYPRRLSGRAEVLVGGRRCPVVGAISMDITLVDVTALESVAVGDEVVLLGAQGGVRISADELADRAGVIPYEITCGISRRVPRVVHR